MGCKTERGDKMNIYEKIQSLKEDLLKDNIKKSGFNDYSNYKYYELSDFLPNIVNLCKKYGLHTKIIFDDQMAKLIIRNIEDPKEFEEYTSPMREFEMKGCNKIQALGGVETYQRRYLYMSAFDIVENDMFDAPPPKITPKQIKAINKMVEDTKSMLAYYNVGAVEDLTMEQASEIIRKKSKGTTK